MAGENLMSTVLSLTDEELTEDVMNGDDEEDVMNGDDEEDVDGDAVLGPVFPKASDSRDALQVLCD